MQGDQRCTDMPRRLQALQQGLLGQIPEGPARSHPPQALPVSWSCHPGQLHMGYRVRGAQMARGGLGHTLALSASGESNMASLRATELEAG